MMLWLRVLGPARSAIPEKQQPKAVRRHLVDYQIGDIDISSITLAELRFGVAKSKQRGKNAQALDEFIIPLEVLPFDEVAVIAYGEIRMRLEKAGTPIVSMDLLIAAHALSVGVTLVTNNTREFSRVQALQVVGWTV